MNDDAFSDNLSDADLETLGIDKDELESEEPKSVDDVDDIVEDDEAPPPRRKKSKKEPEVDEDDGDDEPDDDDDEPDDDEDGYLAYEGVDKDGKEITKITKAQAEEMLAKHADVGKKQRALAAANSAREDTKLALDEAHQRNQQMLQIVKQVFDRAKTSPIPHDDPRIAQMPPADVARMFAEQAEGNKQLDDTFAEIMRVATEDVGPPKTPQQALANGINQGYRIAQTLSAYEGGDDWLAYSSKSEYNQFVAESIKTLMGYGLSKTAARNAVAIKPDEPTLKMMHDLREYKRLKASLKEKPADEKPTRRKTTSAKTGGKGKGKGAAKTDAEYDKRVQTADEFEERYDLTWEQRQAYINNGHSLPPKRRR